MFKFKTRKSLARLLCAALAISTVGIATVWALPPVSWTKVYFSGETIVGEETLLCDGSHSLEGRRTSSWIYVVYEPCPTWKVQQ